MFGRRYFGAVYFAPRWFAQSQGIAVILRVITASVRVLLPRSAVTVDAE
jgi:hypothetical protein